MPKKYASGAWAEAVIAVRAMIDELRPGDPPPLPEADVARERQRVFAPLSQPGPVPARELEERLQKIMDEYAGGISVQYGYAEGTLRIAKLHVERMLGELDALGATTPYELMHCHEVIDRVEVARTLIAHMTHRRETRWHCYQERLDYPERDDERFMIFVNSVLGEDGVPRIIERPVQRMSVDVVLPPLSDGAVIRKPLISSPRSGGEDV